MAMQRHRTVWMKPFFNSRIEISWLSGRILREKAENLGLSRRRRVCGERPNAPVFPSEALQSVEIRRFHDFGDRIGGNRLGNRLRSPRVSWRSRESVPSKAIQSSWESWKPANSGIRGERRPLSRNLCRRVLWMFPYRIRSRRSVGDSVRLWTGLFRRDREGTSDEWIRLYVR